MTIELAYREISTALEKLYTEYFEITFDEYLETVNALYNAMLDFDNLKLYRGVTHFPLHYLVDSIRDVIPSTVKGHEVMKPFQSFLYTH